MRRLLAACAAVAFAGMAHGLARAQVPPPVPSPAVTELHPLVFSALHGWEEDDQALAIAPLRRSCRALTIKPPPKNPGLPHGYDLAPACAALLALPGKLNRAAARAFFEAWFDPALVAPAGDALFTAYFEPEYAGSLTRTEKFSAPLLAWPQTPPDPFPDRAAIESGAFEGHGLELVWLDPVDAFFVHIQGSARITLQNGEVVRVNFAGKNGHPFTPIGRIMIERGTATRESVDGLSIRRFLADNPVEGAALMRENKSYIFFRRDEGRPTEEGPIGAQLQPLTAGRSIAIDDSIWPYGLPVWTEVRLPTDKGSVEMRRLFIAQDTGSAIRGPARGDLYIGTGRDAGRFAARIRHRGHFIVLMPRTAARP